MKISDKNLQIKRLNKQDCILFQKLIFLFQEVFEENNKKISESHYLKQLLEKSDFIVLVAVQENEVVGGLTAYELPGYYSDSSEIFIYDIAVKPEFQRMGIGKRLITELKIFCKANGINEIFVAADEADKHAIDFYKSAGGEGVKVRHFNYKIN